MESSSIILTVAKEIAGVLGKLLSYKKERRESTAAYFEQIADTIVTFCPKLLSGASFEELKELSVRMKTFADDLPSTVGDVIGEEKAKDLSRELKLAYEAKSLLISGETEKLEESLTTLAEAAGHLRASAISLRAAK